MSDGASPHASSARRGPLMIIGGAEDKLRDRLILSRFVALAGGVDAHIVVISTASSLGDQATALYRELFSALGVTRTSGLRPLTREEANDAASAAVLDDATGIFLTGGNQLRLASVIGGTRLGKALRAASDRGAAVAGTSAGASAVSTHMIAYGASGATPKHRMAQVSAGLGLVEGVVVDQHFEQRTRLGRLLALVAQSPGLIGIGLDEDTAAVIDADDQLEVVGRGAVTIIDGSQMATDAFHTRGHKPMMVSGAILHSLPAGCRFDLRTRTLLPTAPRASSARQAAGQRRLAAMARKVAAEGADSFTVEREARRAERRRASE